uniref:Uncharacterized protein n=1 Tax=Rattus norvegicus TaxID=10116 RepID=Q0ZFS9_RAT|nr:unknown [Rattus norvegicus]
MRCKVICTVNYRSLKVSVHICKFYSTIKFIISLR